MGVSYWVYWILKTLLLLVVLNFIGTPAINILTRNSWLKLPLMLLTGITAGVLMVCLQYQPLILFIFWAAFNYGSLKAMEEERNVRQIGVIKKPVYYLSTYAYMIVACLIPIVFEGYLKEYSIDAKVFWEVFLWLLLATIATFMAFTALLRENLPGGFSGALLLLWIPTIVCMFFLKGWKIGILSIILSYGYAWIIAIIIRPFRDKLLFSILGQQQMSME